jgi:hypothetical protein
MSRDWTGCGGDLLDLLYGDIRKLFFTASLLDPFTENPRICVLQKSCAKQNYGG